MTGRVIKAVAGRFFVEIDGRTAVLEGRGKCKRTDRIFVGDIVETDGTAVENIRPRTNRLIRPTVANVDQIAIVLAPTPEPDLLLADKLIIYADALHIPVTLVLNKTDLTSSEDWVSEMTEQYTRAVRSVFAVSTVTGAGIDVLKNEFDGLFSVLAGQSAVGKSSLLNAMGGKELMPTGEVGERSGRGRHTTRHAEIFRCGNALIADTPGFSMLDGAELAFKPEDADYYYTDIFAYSSGCRYHRCTHTHEPDCAVKEAVESRELSAARYERYLKLREELKDVKSYD